MNAAHRTAAVLFAAAAASTLRAGGPSVLWTDPADDAVARLTDPGADGPFNEQGLPDLLSAEMIAWQPDAPASDPYTGQPVDPDQSHFFRLDLKFAGLMNPPGPLGLGGYPYQPQVFGDKPLYGFFELDVDDQKNSGGELEPIALQRFLANVARFGGLPEGSISDRVATSADDFDGDFFSPPQFERTGAELALVMCGCFNPEVVEEGGDGDGVFDPGETWIVRGRFFERMQALADASVVYGGSDLGLYDPPVRLRFAHDMYDDVTTVTLVYPLDTIGAGALFGQEPEPLDFNVANQWSVAEMLLDIICVANNCAATNPSAEVVELVEDWEGRDPEDFLDVTDWRLTALAGTAYTQQEPTLYVWSDVGFEWTFADLSADGLVNVIDESAWQQALAQLDGGPDDADGQTNGQVQIPNFGPNFNLFDLTGDGLIDAQVFRRRSERRRRDERRRPRPDARAMGALPAQRGRARMHSRSERRRRGQRRRSRRPARLVGMSCAARSRVCVSLAPLTGGDARASHTSASALDPQPMMVKTLIHRRLLTAGALIHNHFIARAE